MKTDFEKSEVFSSTILESGSVFWGDGERVQPVACAGAGAGGEVTQLLAVWGNGDRQALNRIIPLVWDQLRAIAHRRVERHGSRLDWEPLDLLQELYLKLADLRRVRLRNRQHFFGFAARAMGRLLIDRSRVQTAKKRGDGIETVPLDEVIAGSPAKVDGLMLGEALEDLRKIDVRQARVARLRVLFGMEHGEIAQVIGVTPRTVKRDWRAARTWLRRRLQPNAAG